MECLEGSPTLNLNLATDEKTKRIILTQGSEIYDQNEGKYIIFKEVGSGTYSNCYYSFCTVNQKCYVLKISTSDNSALNSALSEITISREILKSIENNTKTPDYQDFLNLAITNITIITKKYKHIALISDPLGANLYKYTISKPLNRTGLQGDLSLTDIKNIFRNVLRALYEIHKAKFCHLDVKPENICLYTNDKNEISAKLIDLGSCINIDEMSSDNDDLVTSWYRPPEVVLGYNCDYYKIDVWSLGLTLFEIITGEPLIPAQNQIEILQYTNRMIAPIPEDMIMNSGNKNIYYNAKLKLRSVFGFPPNKYHLLQFRNFHDALKPHLPNEEEFNIINEVLTFMLQPNPEQRISVEDLLKHPFFQ